MNQYKTSSLPHDSDAWNNEYDKRDLVGDSERKECIRCGRDMDIEVKSCHCGSSVFEYI